MGEINWYELFYFLMLGFLITHELDAVKRHEWRILPLTPFFSEKTSEQTFIWMHVPLFAAMFHFGGFNPNSYLAIALSIFAITHIGLHILFYRHPKNEFNNLSSWALIIGAGVFGAAHVLTA